MNRRLRELSSAITSHNFDSVDSQDLVIHFEPHILHEPQPDIIDVPVMIEMALRNPKSIVSILKTQRIRGKFRFYTEADALFLAALFSISQMVLSNCARMRIACSSESCSASTMSCSDSLRLIPKEDCW